jgi:transcriptional regulator with XRE-family HTH domain
MSVHAGVHSLTQQPYDSAKIVPTSPRKRNTARLTLADRLRIGRRIRLLRDMQGITQEALSKRTSEKGRGVSINTISTMESGARLSRREHYDSIALELGTTYDALFAESGTFIPPTAPPSSEAVSFDELLILHRFKKAPRPIQERIARLLDESEAIHKARVNMNVFLAQFDKFSPRDRRLLTQLLESLAEHFGIDTSERRHD